MERMRPVIAGAEVERRWGVLQALMRRARIDALLVSNIANVRYLTGHAPVIAVAPTRPWHVVLPLDGAPIAVVPELGRADLVRDGHVAAIRSWPSPSFDDGEGVDVLLAVLGSLPRRFARLGLELGPETRVGMTVGDLNALRGRMQGWEAVDASALLWEARAVKGEGELACIEAAAGAAGRAFAALPVLLAGLSDPTERGLHRAFHARLILEGADDVPFLPIGSGPGGYASLTAAPTDRRLVPGDVLALDAGVRVEGYWCDFDRNFVLGTPGDAARRAHDRLWAATKAGLAVVRPGVRACDVWAAISAALGLCKDGNAIGRFGHGVGLDLTEPPSVHPRDATVLRKGMVLAIEPSCAFTLPDGSRRFMAHEEMCVVTCVGARLITERAAPNLCVVDALWPARLNR